MKNENNTPNKFELVLTNGTSAKSNSLKENIDKKLEQIEKLKGQLDRLRKQIEIARELFQKHAAFEEKNLNESVEKLILKLYERINQKSFTLWQKDLLESKLLNEIDFLMSNDYKSAEIERIQEELAEKHSNEMSEMEEGFINAMTKDFLKHMGMEVDEENFDFKDITDPAFQEKMHKEFAQQQHERKEQDKHLDQEQKVKATDKDFQKLYRTLVKRAHPDLVGDPKEKEHREIWMKQLSNAWESRNYYTLLLLQKEIDADTSNAIDITQNMLKPLMDRLNKEVKDLEDQKYILQHEDPNTSFFHQNFKGASKKTILKKVEQYRQELEDQNLQIQKEFKRLKTQKSTKDMLKEIDDSQNQLGFYFE